MDAFWPERPVAGNRSIQVDTLPSGLEQRPRIVQLDIHRQHGHGYAACARGRRFCHNGQQEPRRIARTAIQCHGQCKAIAAARSSGASRCQTQNTWPVRSAVITSRPLLAAHRTALPPAAAGGVAEAGKFYSRGCTVSPLPPLRKPRCAATRIASARLRSPKGSLTQNPMTCLC